MTPEQRGILDKLLGVVDPEIGQAGPVFPGQRVAPLSGLQQQSLDLAGQIPGQMQGAQQMGMDTLQGLMSGTGPATQAAQNLFTEQIAPNIMGTFAQTGSANSGLAQKALADAGANLSLNLQNQLAGQQLGALSQLPGVAGMSGVGAGQLQALGALPQQQQQAQIGSQMDMFREQQPLFSPFFSAGAQLAGMPAFENIGMQQGAGLGRELIGASVSGAASALPMMAMMSDKELKEDVKTLFRYKGVRFVTWKWKKIAGKYGLTGMSFGVIAQELKKIYPDLVHMLNSGYLCVNYKGLCERVA